MQPLGIVLKQIREAKGFTQKAVYDGIISRSFAIRLESGQHDVTATKMFAILDRLGVNANEFRFIQNNYRPTPSEQARSRVMLAYDQQNFPQLAHLADHYAQSRNPAEQRIAIMARLLLLAFDKRAIHLTPEMDHLWQQLRLTRTWTLQEIEFGAIIVVFAAEKHTPLPAIIRKYHLACERYVSAQADPFRVMDHRASFDLVALQQLLNQNQYADAKDFKQQLLDGHLEYLTSDGTLDQQLSLWLWESYFGDVTTAAKMATALRQLPASRFSPGIHTLLTMWHQNATRYRQSADS